MACVLIPPTQQERSHMGYQDSGIRTGSIDSSELPLIGKRLLILDDDLLFLDTMHNFLTLHGAEVRAFDQGDLALEWLESHFSDCDGVLTDIRMPIMDGFAVARHIRQNLGLKRLPIIAVSGEVREKEAGEEPFDLFNEAIRKPFHPMALIESLSQHI